MVAPSPGRVQLDPAMRLALVIASLDAVVDRDRLRLSRDAAAHHQHDTELSEGVHEGQHHGGQDPRSGQRQLDATEGLLHAEPADRGRFTELARNGLEGAMHRLRDKGHVEDDGCQ